jgi:hypothetical protein
MELFRTGVFDDETTNAALSWGALAVLLIAGIEHFRSGDVLWAGLAAIVIGVILVPPVFSGNPHTMVGWQVVAIAALPVLARAIGLFGKVGTYVTVATLALIVAAEIDSFTDVEMTSEFAVVFVVVVTMAVAGVWSFVQFTADIYLGTSALEDQTTLMWELIAATGIGVVAGVVFALFVRRSEVDSDPHLSPKRAPISDDDRKRRPLPRRLADVLQASLLVLTLYGVYVGSYDLVVNGALAYGATLVPMLIKRRYDYRIDPRLVLWITVAALLHTLGFLGPYGTETGIVSYYDHLTHMLSAAFLAGIGHAFLSALDVRSDQINLGEDFRSLFTVVFILATGVAWEIAEFAAGPVGSFITGKEILTQYGIEDIVLDLFFNTVAAVLVALWGLGYFVDFVRLFSTGLARFRRH